ncbi:MAG: DUF2911 domain-containing protein [Thermonemataceae bacterium]
MKKSLFIILLISVWGWEATAQRVITPKEKKSPLAMAILKKNNNYLKVTYGQPYKRDREVFGKLVPYDEVWRTGANEATEFTTIRDIKFGDKTLKAGTYTIFTIPSEEKWTVILNGELGQWGNYSYDKVKEKDVLKIEAPASEIKDEYEAFTIKFFEKENGADMQLVWAQTQVDVPITFIR